MKTVSEIRHQNFLLLFEMFKKQVWASWPDEPERGMLRKMSKAYGLSERWLSHVKVGRKTVGHNTARKLEDLFGLSVGWMDQEHYSDKPRSKAEDAFLASALMLYRMAPAKAQKEMLTFMREQLTDSDHERPAPKTASKAAKKRPRKAA